MKHYKLYKYGAKTPGGIRLSSEDDFLDEIRRAAQLVRHWKGRDDKWQKDNLPLTRERLEEAFSLWQQHKE